ncbi:MAG TPA: HupE/UreJ family protein, partial [Thermoanaerobaculia bacterium]|nr:HupE/UreJ family protein [Thermoanaerobaculia bacterium]
MPRKSHGLWLTAALLLLAAAARPAAHDIPNDVTVQAFVKPEGQHLRLLMRVPLGAMRDMDYPKPRGRTNADLLDLGRADQSLRDAATLWLSDFLDLYENDRPIGAPQVASVRAALQSDRSFASYDEALAHVTGPRLPETTEFFWSQGLLDVLFEYPIQSDRSKFSIRPRLGRLGIRTLTILRFLPQDGTVRSFEFYGDPGLVRLDPTWRQAASQFVRLGFFHIVDGVDHLLFLACLVIPFRRFGPLAAVVTAFTLAHSITLVASAYNLAPDALWFPPLIDTLIALSIVYMALENIVLAGREVLGAGSDPDGGGSSSRALKRRWLVTFAFGLAHGFGFSFALRDTLQFAGTHLLSSLVSFNLGIEAGQLLVLVLLIPAVDLAFRYLVREQLGVILLSAIVSHTAWHWMIERLGTLRQFRFQWPVVD